MRAERESNSRAQCTKPKALTFGLLHRLLNVVSGLVSVRLASLVVRMAVSNGNRPSGAEPKLILNDQNPPEGCEGRTARQDGD